MCVVAFIIFCVYFCTSFIINKYCLVPPRVLSLLQKETSGYWWTRYFMVHISFLSPDKCQKHSWEHIALILIAWPLPFCVHLTALWWQCHMVAIKLVCDIYVCVCVTSLKCHVRTCYATWYACCVGCTSILTVLCLNSCSSPFSQHARSCCKSSVVLHMILLQLRCVCAVVALGMNCEAVLVCSYPTPAV